MSATITKQTKAVDFREVSSRELQDRLSRIASTEFVFIGSGEGVRYWLDTIEYTFYREHTCNGPSSWARGTLP